MDHAFSPMLPAARPNAPVVLLLVAFTALPEVLFTLAGTGLIGAGWLRDWALVHGAFWRGLLADWEAVFPFQREAMFLTYALLHGGLLHLVGNMVVVLAISGIVVARLGQGGFLILYVVSALGGSVGYAILSSSLAPMVGASGAVFGLMGAWKYWEWRGRRAVGAPMGPVWRFLAGLVAVNLVLWVALSGLLAWEAHLGGFVAGWLWAAFATPAGRLRRV